MRKLIDGSLCLLGLIADSASFTGCLEDESGYFSDASLYDDDISDDEHFKAETTLDTHGAEMLHKRKASSFEGHNDSVGEVSNVSIDDDSDLILGAALNHITRSKLAKRLKRNDNNGKVISEVMSAASKRTGKNIVVRGNRHTSRAPDVERSDCDGMNNDLDRLVTDDLGDETKILKVDGDLVEKSIKKKKIENGKSYQTISGRKRSIGGHIKTDAGECKSDLEMTHAMGIGTQGTVVSIPSKQSDQDIQKSKRGRPRKLKGTENEAVNLSAAVVKVERVTNSCAEETLCIDKHQVKALPVDQQDIIAEKQGAYSVTTPPSNKNIGQVTSISYDGDIASREAHQSKAVVPKKVLAIKKAENRSCRAGIVKAAVGDSEDVGSATSHDNEVQAKAQGRVESGSMEQVKEKVKNVSSVKNAGEDATSTRSRKVKPTEGSEMKDARFCKGSYVGKGAKAFNRMKGAEKDMAIARTNVETKQRVLEGSHKRGGKGPSNSPEMEAKTLEAKNEKHLKANDVPSVVSIQRKKIQGQTLGRVVPAVANNKTSGMILPTKDSKRSVQKGSETLNISRDNGGFLSHSKHAELVSHGTLKAVATKALPSTQHLLNGVNDRKSKAAHTEITMRRDIVHSSSTRKLAFSKGHQDHMATLQGSLESVHSVVEQQKVAIEKDGDNGVVGEEVSSGVTEGGERSKIPGTNEKGDCSSKTELGNTGVGWVLCDECQKWRCIPAELADDIDATKRRWSCKDNPDKKFADCCVPQEKSNAEINKELNISEVSDCEEGDAKDPPVDSKLLNGHPNQDHDPATWTLIKHNIFQHRRRKIQTIDEIMVCQCVPPEDGGVGCGEECLNRLLSIECIPQTCPCGDLCSNQQFQRRFYANVGWFRCGKKGFGLQALAFVPKGSFIIEYVGEVLDMAAYEARQREYALRGQKHFYFMTLNSNEVIDACTKGNLGRFINHSCEPNCTTEKWMINGEVCIGLFAIRDLVQGEEITFDYNYVRVCGAAAKKCLCGSTECRGFIGGDPMTPVAIVESDTDEEDKEPVMLVESSEEEEAQIEKSKSVIDKKLQGKRDVLTICAPNVNTNWASAQASDKQGLIPKRVKTNSTLGKFGTNAKTLTIETSGGRFEGVEERLNELIDENGGLCKRREAATHYLKLLVVTAASGDTVNGEASRSTRDLSVVLDALLKTVSRFVLLEIAKKNGLQILHNMIKRYRRNYKKTPIIRKLLKVLEFLATKNVLTIEQINTQPSHCKVESVRDTIFELCRHNDTEVQQIARRFRDKWIPRNFPRKLLRGQEGFYANSEYHDNNAFSQQQHEPQPYQAEGDTHHGQYMAGSNDELERRRKRPSRWDQPSQEVLDATLAGGLPQSFWPLSTNNLVLGKNQQILSDQALRNGDTTSCEEFGNRHPVGPLFPAFEQQHHSGLYTGAHLPPVVNGIPVGQFMAAPSAGFITQQVSICVGIPVALGHHLNSAHTTGSDCSCCSQVLASSNPINPTENGHSLASSSTTELQEQKLPADKVLSSGETCKGPNVIFGVSPSQFFQQMHGLFGLSFHPWQLQALMAPHSWGPYLSGDGRVVDLKASGPMSWSSNFNGSDGSIAMTGPDADGAGGQHLEPNLEPEPPVPGLSPPRFRPQVIEPMIRQDIAEENLEKGSLSSSQYNSCMGRPWKLNAHRWPKYRGSRYRGFGRRRDYGNPRRHNRQNFPWRGPLNSSSHSQSHWDDVPHRHDPSRNTVHSSACPLDAEEFVGTEMEGKPFAFGQDESFEECMPLERPWGFGQEDYFKEDVDSFLNTAEDFSHEREVEDVRLRHDNQQF